MPPKNIDEYISQFNSTTQSKLQLIRKVVAQKFPKATETINYGIPTFQLDGKNLFHFAAYKNHIGIYPGPDAIDKIKKDLSDFKISKGSIQLPIDQSIPQYLLKKILEHL